VLYHFDAVQRIALAARELGIPATVVMPREVRAAEVATTQGYGATVVLYDRYIEEREQSTRAMAPPPILVQYRCGTLASGGTPPVHCYS